MLKSEGLRPIPIISLGIAMGKRSHPLTVLGRSTEVPSGGRQAKLPSDQPKQVNRMCIDLLAVVAGCLTTRIPIAPSLNAALMRQSVQQQVPDTTPPKKREPRTLETVHVAASRSSKGYAGLRSSSATRTDLPLRDTPRSVSVVTHALIADQAMQSMADVARYVPGVSMASGEGHRDQPTIRGNNTTADFFVDGIRDDGQYLRDLYNVDRVEVLKGSDAMIFGRGGGGGVINRVTRQAEWAPVRTVTLEGGSFAHGRGTIDVGQGLTSWAAARTTAMYEHSGGFRDAASLTRFGANPTVVLTPSENALVRASYERFEDRRVVDRGIPSFQGRPAPSAIATFFGNPTVNHADARVDLATASIEQHLGGLTLRDRVSLGVYDKFYQNTFPGVVDPTGATVRLSAYNHAIARHNLMNVADATYGFGTGSVRHFMLVGADVVRQHTGQVRRTGYFGDSAATLSVPFEAPTVSSPVTFRPSATDADNSLVAHDAAVYVQDQIALTSQWLVIAGVRYERFAANYHNNRTDADLDRVDRLLSPRAGLVYKPVDRVSLYGSYGVSHLPSAGDQFTSLTVTSATLEPERFTNREVGIKWDAPHDLSVTAALYRLDRTNTSAPDPNTAGLVVQTGAQRTTGWELGVNGELLPRWQIAAGFASQRATIVSTTTAAIAGATVALVPRTALSWWNHYQLTSALGLGAGVVHQSTMYAAVDNSVVLPAFTRVDGAVYARLARDIQAQLNVENVLNTRYYATTQGNNNIMPGAPRTLRVSLTAGLNTLAR